MKKKIEQGLRWLYTVWEDYSQDWTKDGLAVALLLSIVFNVVQGIDRGNAEATLVKQEQTIQSYKELFDSAEMEAHELLDVTNHIKAKNPKLPPIVREEWGRAFIQAGDTMNLSPKLLIAVADVESRVFQVTPEGFDLFTCSRRGTTMTSCAGARGVMQVMPLWAKDCPYSINAEALKHATVNIWCGAYVLSHYRDMFKGNMVLAILAYNRGEHPVLRALKAGRDPANGYAKKVLERARKYLEV